jgi:hypothetical protein
MGTLRLVEESRTEVYGETKWSRSRSAWKGALKRTGYHLVDAKEAASASGSLCQVPPDVIVLTGPVPDSELLDPRAVRRHDSAAKKSGSSSSQIPRSEPARILSSRRLLVHSIRRSAPATVLAGRLSGAVTAETNGSQSFHDSVRMG